MIIMGVVQGQKIPPPPLFDSWSPTTFDIKEVWLYQKVCVPTLSTAIDHCVALLPNQGLNYYALGSNISSI